MASKDNGTQRNYKCFVTRVGGTTTTVVYNRAKSPENAALKAVFNTVRGAIATHITDSYYRVTSYRTASRDWIVDVKEVNGDTN